MRGAGAAIILVMSTAAAAVAVTRVIPLAAARRRPTPESRAVYELARLRVAESREPPVRFPQLSRRHD